MKIGDEEITRNMMPAQIQWQQANPDHIRQTIQDVLRQNLGQALQMPQGEIPQQGSMEQGSQQWQ